MGFNSGFKGLIASPSNHHEVITSNADGGGHSPAFPDGLPITIACHILQGCDIRIPRDPPPPPPAHTLNSVLVSWYFTSGFRT